jgi:hypothetical protein
MNMKQITGYGGAEKFGWQGGPDLVGQSGMTRPGHAQEKPRWELDQPKANTIEAVMNYYKEFFRPEYQEKLMDLLGDDYHYLADKLTEVMKGVSSRHITPDNLLIHNLNNAQVAFGFLKRIAAGKIVPADWGKKFLEIVEYLKSLDEKSLSRELGQGPHAKF